MFAVSCIACLKNTKREGGGTGQVIPIWEGQTQEEEGGGGGGTLVIAGEVEGVEVIWLASFSLWGHLIYNNRTGNFLKNMFLSRL